MNKQRWGAAIGALALACSAGASATAIDPGDYVAAPPGTLLALLYWQFSDADALYAHGKKVAGNPLLETEVAIARYVSYVKIGDTTIDLQLLLPYVNVHAGGSVAALGNAKGMADPILVSTIWLVNKPEQRTYFGITPYLYLPVGAYNPNRALNPGNHRWQCVLQAVVSQGLGQHWTAELSADAQWNGQNDRYNGHEVLKQRTVYDLQGFLRYTIDPANEVSLRIRHVSGGDETINGVDQDDLTETTSALFGYSHNFANHMQLLVEAGRDISVQNGFRESARFQLRVLKAF